MKLQTSSSHSTSERRAARGGTLILGGGFGGAQVARCLGKRGATIVTPEISMLYTPLLPEVAAGAVRTDAGELTVGYENLVVALGAVVSWLPIPGLDQHSVGFENLGDAVHLRDRVLRPARHGERGSRERRASSFVRVHRRLCGRQGAGGGSGPGAGRAASPPGSALCAAAVGARRPRPQDSPESTGRSRRLRRRDTRTRQGHREAVRNRQRQGHRRLELGLFGRSGDHALSRSQGDPA